MAEADLPARIICGSPTTSSASSPDGSSASPRCVQARDAAIPFKCLLRADQVTPAVARALRAAGCRTAWIGAESGSQRILDAMEKGTRVDQIANATGLLHGAGVEVGFFLQFGYPGETREDIERTLQMVRDCAPDDIGVSVSYPLPGHDVLRARQGAARAEAELGRLERPRDDVPRDLRARVLPRAARARARRVPRAQVARRRVARSSGVRGRRGRATSRAALSAPYHAVHGVAAAPASEPARAAGRRRAADAARPAADAAGRRRADRSSGAEVRTHVHESNAARAGRAR